MFLSLVNWMCWSMQQEEIDTGVTEYLMAISGYVMNEEVERALSAENG